jgi:prepilin-type N-terminal cleavage/methylation domain-containing protein
MKLKKRSAFSLLEIIAAVIILAIVATATVSTVAPMRAKSDAKLNEASLANLNAMAQTFFMERGVWPTRDGGIVDLANHGYIDAKNNPANYDKMRAEFVWDPRANQFVAQ